MLQYPQKSEGLDGGRERFWGLYLPPGTQRGSKKGLQPVLRGLKPQTVRGPSQLRLPVLLAARRSSCGVGTVEGNNPCVPSSVLRSWLERGGFVVRDKPFSNPGDPSDPEAVVL